MAQNHGLKYIEASAFFDKNIDVAFNELALLILE